MKTTLGWIISGPTSSQGHSVPRASINLQMEEMELNTLLRKFWEIEEAPSTKKLLTREEQHCEDCYTNTVKRNEKGRYIVRLPLKPSFPSSEKLGDSFSPAKRMLRNMEKRFERDPKLKAAYTESINTSLALGYMRHVSSSDLDLEKCFFLPHHAVIKENSTTTKLRTVFNASMKTTKGFSLNDLMYVGPNLLPDLTDLITRWRCFSHVFVADIEKMFNQVLMHPNDQHLQAIVWREESSQAVQLYFLTTVTFGFICSTYLACRTLKQLAEDEGSKHPLAVEVIKEDTYVDDVLSGGHSLEHAKHKQRDIIDLLAKGGFSLRKWLSNEAKLVDWLPRELLTSQKSLSMDLGFSVLGISWYPAEDCFRFKFAPEPLTGPINKRSVLSKVAKLYDPLGWIAPVIVTAKIFMQSLWVLSRDWDSVLPLEQQHFWKEWYPLLNYLTDLKIPRWTGVTSDSQTYEIHGFADASKRAYAAVVYLRVIDAGVKVLLLGTKTKVAPIKTLSIPRLELCAALLLAKLARHQVDTLKLPKVEVHLWSDSRDVLYWIRDIPRKWPTFVANRCAEISTSLPDAYWHHVNSADNPADIASRGSSVEDLARNPLWWQGPTRVIESNTEWNKTHDLGYTGGQLEASVSL